MLEFIQVLRFYAHREEISVDHRNPPVEFFVYVFVADGTASVFANPSDLPSDFPAASQLISCVSWKQEIGSKSRPIAVLKRQVTESCLSSFFSNPSKHHSLQYFNFHPYSFPLPLFFHCAVEKNSITWMNIILEDGILTFSPFYLSKILSFPLSLSPIC